MAPIATRAARLWISVSACLSLSLSIAPASAQPAPGDALPKDATVSHNTGAAQFRVPIQVPPGPGGFQPDLALSYSSLRGDGPYGVGFRLEPLGEIRCSSRFGVPDYVTCPRFELDGQLLTEDPSPPAGERRFHPFVESFERIRAIPHHQSVPDAWEVTRPDGTVLSFGDSENARIYSGETVARWLLSALRDPFGPTIDFSYTQDPDGPGGLSPDTGTLYPSQVSYADGTRQIEFHWEPRPDPIHDFAGGIEREIKWRLLEIEVRSNGNVYRRQRFRYNERGPYTTGRSRMSSVEVYGADCTAADPATSCPRLPAEEFDYTDTPASGAHVQWVEAPGYRIRLGGQVNYGNDPRHVADIDGDGLVDQLVMGQAHAGPQTLEVLLNTGTGFVKDEAWTAAAASLTTLVPRVDVRQVDENDPLDPWDEFVADHPDTGGKAERGICQLLAAQVLEQPIAERFAFKDRPAASYSTWSTGQTTPDDSHLEGIARWFLTDLDGDGRADLVMSIRLNGVHETLDCADGTPVPPVAHAALSAARAYRNTGSGWVADPSLVTELPPFEEINTEGAHYVERHAGVGFTAEEVFWNSDHNGCMARGLPGLWEEPNSATHVISELCYSLINLDPRFVDFNGDGYTDLMVLERDDPANPWVGFTSSPKMAPNLARSRAWIQRPGEDPRWVRAPEFDLPLDTPADLPTGLKFAHSWQDTLHTWYESLGCIANISWLFCAPAHYTLSNGMQLVDVNRDGLVDVVWSLHDYAHPYLPFSRGVLLNMGSGTGTAGAWCASDPAIGAALGSGGDVQTCAWADRYLPPDDGYGLAWRRHHLDYFPRRSGFLADLNGDGWLDYLSHSIHYAVGTESWIYDPGAAEGWLDDPQQRFDLPMTSSDWTNAIAEWNGSYTSGFAVLDVNGDGVSDVVGDTKAFVSVHPHPDLVERMRNGQGGEIELRYGSASGQRAPALESLADAHAHEPGIDEAPGAALHDIQRWTSAPVVTSLSLRGPNLAPGVSHAYRYAHPRFCVASRSSLGFRLLEQTRPDGSIVEYYYYQHHGRAGRISRTRTLEAGALVHLHEEDWEIPTSFVPGSLRDPQNGALQHPDVHVGRLAELRSANRYGAETGALYTRTLSYRDAEADVEHGYNFVLQVEETRPTGRLITQRTPEPPDLDAHLVARVAEQIERDANGERLSYRSYLYFDPSLRSTYDKPAITRVWDQARYDAQAPYRVLDTLHQYDSYGNLVEQIDPAGRIRRFCYDTGVESPHCPAGHGSNSLLVGIQDPGIGDEPGRWTTSTPHPILEQPIRIRSQYADVPTVDRSYDAFGRVLGEWSTPAGLDPDTDALLSQSIEWLDTEPPYSRIQAFVDAAASESDAIESITVTNGFGETWKSIARSPNGDYVGTLQWRDPTQRMRRTTLPLACGTDPTCSGSDGASQPLANETRSDALGRPVRIDTPGGFSSVHYRHAQRTQPAGPSSLEDFDAVLVKNGKGDLSERLIDGDRLVWLDACDNQVTPEHDLEATDLCSSPDSTFHSYEPTGELAGLFDPRQRYTDPNHVTRYHYDTLGRILRVEDPDRSGPTPETSRRYDSAGNVAATTNARGQERLYHYDALDRLVAVDTPVGEPDLSVTYRADERQRWKELAPHYTREYAYDELGRPERERLRIRWAGGGAWWNLVTDRVHDLQGRLVQITHPDTTSIRYEYAGPGLERVCELLEDATDCASTAALPYLTDVVYDELGRRQVLRGEHGDRTFQYDSEHRLLRDSFESGPGGSYAYTRDYLQYDEIGNILAIGGSSSLPGIDMAPSYTYDHKNRLESWTPSPGASERHYAYDDLDNLTLHADREQRYDHLEQPRAISEGMSGTRLYTYDADGNVGSISSASSSQHFEFDSANRLTCVGPEPGVCTNQIAYDLDGRRIYDASGGVYTAYVGDTFVYTTEFQRWRGTQSRVEIGAFGERLAFKRTLHPPLHGGAPITGRAPARLPDAAAALLIVSLLFVAGAGIAVIALGSPGRAPVCIALVIAIAVPPLTLSARTRRNAVRFWELADPLGTGLVVVNESGNRIAHHAFEPFGRIYDSVGYFGTRQYFAGHLYDGEKDLYYMQARWYDANAGRLLGVDPVLDLRRHRSQNAYSYAANNPLAYTDPTGLAECIANCPSYGGVWIPMNFSSGGGGGGGGGGGSAGAAAGASGGGGGGAAGGGDGTTAPAGEPSPWPSAVRDSLLDSANDAIEGVDRAISQREDDILETLDSIEYWEQALEDLEDRLMNPDKEAFQDTVNRLVDGVAKALRDRQAPGGIDGASEGQFRTWNLTVRIRLASSHLERARRDLVQNIAALRRSRIHQVSLLDTRATIEALF